jgi:SAM-dependent MidA family methyltransferase
MTASLFQILQKEIKEHGPMRFDHFMEKTLYHPALGFYFSGQARTGSKGDFLTPVSTGPVLGQLLALQLEELYATLGGPSSLFLCEQGADRGYLAHDLLDSICKFHPNLSSVVQLHIIEPCPTLLQQQKSHLAKPHNNIPIHWHPDLFSFKPHSSPVFFYSSELIDSFPVRVARFSSGQWMERFVTEKRGRLDWLDGPADKGLLSKIDIWKIPRSEGFTAEIRPNAATWIQTLSQQIQQGMILTLDYGMLAPELYHPSRSSGTLMSISRHTPSPDPLINPGQQDLTAHVNFTELIEEGEKSGLTTLGLSDFSGALIRLATPLLHDNQPMPEKWIRNFNHLTHPAFFGKSHRILIQGKNLPTGFRPSMTPL